MNGRKRFQKFLTAAVIAAMCLTSGASCGINRDSGEKIDENRTQVFINYYNGGLGMEWMAALKNAFEKIYPDIQIMPLPGKGTMDAGTVLDNFDTYDGDLFFMDYVGSEYLKQFRSKGLIADITKYVKDEKIDKFGEDKSIWDKMTPAVKGYYDIDGVV